MLKWTKVPPTRYGLYWVKFENSEDDIVEVRKGWNNSFVIVSIGNPIHESMEEFIKKYHQTLWYGPLEAPEEVK